MFGREREVSDVASRECNARNPTVVVGLLCLEQLMYSEMREEPNPQL